MCRENKNVLIYNIYYMLAYVFLNSLDQMEKNIEEEEFEDAYDLFAFLLAKNLSYQIKRGLYKEYIEHEEDLTTIRGKLNINETMRHRAGNRRTVTCEYDELTEDNKFNRIIKSTMLVLLRSSSVKDSHKIKLKTCLPYFDTVREVRRDMIAWDKLTYHKGNSSYRLLMNLCYFILSNLLLSSRDGKFRFKEFGGTQLSALYEKFILEYFRKTYHSLKVGLDQRDLNYDPDQSDEGVLGFLPKYKTDVMLSCSENGKLLIIDAKYYSNILTEHNESHKLRNNHLNQIMVYVWNHKADNKYTSVDGMLLYAKTQHEEIPEGKAVILGNNIYIQTLDLNTKFPMIKAKLDSIAAMVLNI